MRLIQRAAGFVSGAMQSIAFAALWPRSPGHMLGLAGAGWRQTNATGRLRMHRPSDGENINQPRLIAAIVSHSDRAAFAALFGLYAPRIKGFLMRTGSAAEMAEEIAQETMLSVWRKATLFDASRASVATWIYTIARNLRIDRLRKDRGVSAEIVNEALVGDEPARPDDTLESAQREERLRGAFEVLSDEQMAVVRLSFFEDKAHADIARSLGIPLGTVKSRLRLAMAKLRQRLDETS
jgi:RNA polymerase sigma-70 factor, ECF subfamily